MKWTDYAVTLRDGTKRLVRAILKAVDLPAGYIKEGRTNPLGGIYPCRGAYRAARRRKMRGFAGAA